MKEIINVVKHPSVPHMTLQCLPGVNPEKIGCSLVYKTLRDLVLYWSNDNPDPARVELIGSFWSSFSYTGDDIRFVTFNLNREKTLQIGLTPHGIASSIRDIQSFWEKATHDKNVYLSYSHQSSDKWWVALVCSTSDGLWMETESILKRKSNFVVSDQLVSYTMYEHLLDHRIGGVSGVFDFFCDSTHSITTKGSNLLGVLALDGFDHNLTTTNCLTEIISVFGIDAARRWIEQELGSVMSTNNANVSVRHIQLLSSVICYRGYITPMTYQGICPPGTSVMKKAAFEKAMESFLLGAQQGQLDTGESVTEAVTWNSRLRCGTGQVELIAPHVEDKLYARGSWFGSRCVPYLIPDDHNLFRPFKPEIDEPVLIELPNTHIQDAVFLTESDTCEFIPTSPVQIDECDILFLTDGDEFVPYSPCSE